jgi:hypothetical protein
VYKHQSLAIEVNSFANRTIKIGPYCISFIIYLSLPQINLEACRVN